MGKIKDRTGETIGRLTLIELISVKNKSCIWKMKCSCGNIVEKDVFIISKSKFPSCGCWYKEESHKRRPNVKCYENLTGQIFGKLTVISKAEDKFDKKGRKIVQWNCLCECGNTKIVTRESLKKGHTTSCGCARLGNFIGKRFTNLVVESVYEKCETPSGGKIIKWLCQCDCGNTTIVSTSNLLRNHTTSCGCKKLSSQEKVICDMLNTLCISFEMEYKFDDLRSGLINECCRFDFAIFDENKILIALIEYQGIQHYVEIPQYKSFSLQQRKYTDKLKKEYCRIHNIPLYKIKYTEDTQTALLNILHTIYDNTVPSSQETA